MWKIPLLLSIALPAFAVELREEAVEHESCRFRVLRVDPGDVDIVWKGADGQPLARFDQVREHVVVAGETLRFVMNAGIFEPGLVPSGLHIEDGKTLRPVNLSRGEGNFFLRPNGVFAVTRDGKAVVVESAAYGQDPPAARLALQSGPVMLLGGIRHPAFKKGSASIKHRNGVGIDADGRVVFAMTAKGQEVNFWDFAGLFLMLGCRDALFLDGDISQMAFDPEAGVRSNRFAAMLVVAE